jgi:DNA (cytosine-5)-methyltransferase 1
MPDLTYLELFAGAGGMSLGLETAGWRCVAHAEIEPHARAVLRHHWPDVPLYGDVTELDGTQFRGVTMVTGGSPCQDLSIAGKRAGMTEGSGTRSSLFFEQVRIWNESQAPYILWENVYGAFSSNAGRDFAAVLSALVGAAVPVPSDGWVRAGVVAGPAGVAAWRTLDAQYFGVPQRRRRVFVLGARAGGVDPAEVFALAESLSGHLATSGEAGEGVAAGAGAGALGSGIGFSTTGSVGYVHEDVMPTLPHLTGLNCPGAQMVGVLAVNISGGVGRLESVMGTLDADGASTTAIGAQTRGVVLTYDARGNGEAERSLTLGTANDQVVFPPLQATDATKWGSNQWVNEGKAIIAPGIGIPRRLTPVECERLMGWPDQHTAHGINEKGTAYALADTARYKLCGNGIASPVTAWIGFQLRRLLTRDK